MITTSRLSLRLGIEPDIGGIIEFYRKNQGRIQPHAPTFTTEFFTAEYWTKRLVSDQRDFEAGTSARFFLFLKTGRELMGTAALTTITRGALSACYLAYNIDGRYEGRGLMKEALEEGVIPYVFEGLKLHRIMANAQPFNERSLKLLERLGFSREGVARDYLFLDGKWRDHVLTSKINSHWKI